ncbi:MAG TPA: hypothetical protein VFW39_04060 [Sphingomicrobium sp.]|nr:hypothetical protein [Sphingomicrobium sp.]
MPALLPFWLALLFAGFIVTVLIGITIGFPLADHQEARGPLQALPPAPRIETAPGVDLARYQAAKRAELKRRDQAGQSAIDAAMNATAEQGWGPSK